MDQIVVDVGDLPVAAGDAAVLFGPVRDGEPLAQDWADAVGTIHYEIVTRIGPRVTRTYVGAEDERPPGRSTLADRRRSSQARSGDAGLGTTGSRPGDLIVLVGPLGAGKTALVQGIGAGLGVRGDGRLADVRHRAGASPAGCRWCTSTPTGSARWTRSTTSTSTWTSPTR